MPVRQRALPTSRMARPRRAVGAALLTGLLAAIGGLPVAGIAVAAGPIHSAGFGGGTGTAVVGSTVFAKSGAALTLTVVTDPAVGCVVLSGAHSGSSTAPSGSTPTEATWLFSTTALTGADGSRTTTVGTYSDAACTTSTASTTASYSVDNTAPVVTFTLSQPRSVFGGWNNTAVTITWAAVDMGSGVVSGPTPATATQTTATFGTSKASTATDAVGNVGSASTIIKLDPTAPSIVGTRNPPANADGWNNTNVSITFSCSDGMSGIWTCTSPSSFTTNVAGQFVTGTALDFAGNTTSISLGPVNIDKNAPTLSGTPLNGPNAAGWYNADVAVNWTCADTGGSGFAPNACANTMITGEGVGLTASKSVADLAGNSSGAAISSPSVRIDRTAPTTAASSVAPWSSTAVTVGLTASDGLSGVAATHYMVDDGSDHTYGAGDVISLTTDGSHELEFWSVDAAGNEEAHQSLTVGVDKTAPLVTVAQSPAANANGWNDSAVVVSFTCSDGTSGVASCPADVTVSGEGADQPVSATAVDNAGNSSIATTSVSIDKTAPTIAGSASPAANSSGWTNTDVVVSYSCADALSGISSCATSDTLSGEGAGQSVAGRALDLAGNAASVTVGGINIDKTPPVVRVVGVVDGATYDPGGFSASCSTSDALAGVAAAAALSQSGGPTGSLTLTCSGASDRAGNAQAKPVSVTINVRAAVEGYQFGGFQRPLSTRGVNDVNAGASVPVKFSLGGYRGMNVFMAGSPASVAFRCGTVPPTTGFESVATNGGGLSYDTASDTYSFVWKTTKAWTGCRMLVVNFSDGSTATGLFNFTK